MIVSFNLAAAAGSRKPPITWTELVADAQKVTVHEALSTVTQREVGIPTSGITSQSHRWLPPKR